MTDLQATLDAIDELAVHECGHCSKPLPADSQSLDYCGPDCQSAWLAAKQEVIELVGYREPVDLPQYQGNLVELCSPETASPTGDLRGSPGHRPGSYTTPPDLATLLASVRPFERELLNTWTASRPERDDAAIERAQTGRWLARFAAPWHPQSMTVRSEYQGRPPERLHAIRPAPMPIWTMEDPIAESTTLRPDVYQLESVDEHNRSAIYRIQGLPGPRLAVFRWAGDSHAPTWWHQGDWEGRLVEVENGALGHRWSHPDGLLVQALPTERYEEREDGTVAEVWVAAPDREAMRRAELRRLMIEQSIAARVRAAADPISFIRITGV